MQVDTHTWQIFLTDTDFVTCDKLHALSRSACDIVNNIWPSNDLTCAIATPISVKNPQMTGTLPSHHSIGLQRRP